MFFTREKIKKLIDDRMEQIERFRKYTGDEKADYAIANLKGMKKDFGVK